VNDELLNSAVGNNRGDGRHGVYLFCRVAGGEMSDKLRAAAKTKMTLAELSNMISMANTITFSRDMHRATPEAIQKELLACINEWLRGDDKATRLKREKNT
jgi:hypothetical protein